MSGVLAACNRDGDPIGDGPFERAMAALRSFAHDRSGHCRFGSGAVACAELITTFEQRAASQPAVDAEAQVAVAFDGRLDNREALAAQLDGPETGPRAARTDAQLVLDAYRRWGRPFVTHLLGDFGFVVWDGRRRVLLGGRDHLGLRPLHYATVGPTTVVSSWLPVVLAWPGVSTQADEGFVAEWLSGFVVSQDATPYRSIRRVPAAHIVIVDDAGVRTEPWWVADLEPDETMTPNGAVAAYRSVLEKAVRSCLRTDGRIGISLSGGLDSSSITAVAAALARAEGGPPVETWSMVFPGSPIADESDLIAQTAQWCRVPSRREEVTPRTLADIDAEASRYRDLPDSPNAGNDVLPAGDRARRVLLTGYGGDEWFEGCPFLLADLVARGRLVMAFRLARGRFDLRTMRGWRAAVNGYALRPFLQAVVPRLAAPEGESPLVAPALSRRIDLRARLRLPPAPEPHANRWRWAALVSGEASLANEQGARTPAARAFELRSPFHDRRVVEFANRVPETIRWHMGDRRWLERSGIEGRLPTAVWRNRQKAEFSVTLRREFHQLAREGGLDLPLGTDNGGVDATAAERARAERLREGATDRPSATASHLWRAVAIERWLGCLV